MAFGQEVEENFVYDAMAFRQEEEQKQNNKKEKEKRSLFS